MPDGVSLLCLSKPAGHTSFYPPITLSPHHFSTLPPYNDTIPLFNHLLWPPGPYKNLNWHTYWFTTCIFHIIPVYSFLLPWPFSFTSPRNLFIPADYSPSPRLCLCSLYHLSTLCFSVTSRGMIGLWRACGHRDWWQLRSWLVYLLHSMAQLCCW